MARRLILLTGIPATGKTTVGNYLRDNHGFYHIDFEDGISRNQFASDPGNFLTSLTTKDKIVISWGFCPDEADIPLIIYLKNNGFELFWFEGDHVTALKKYIERGRGTNLDAYYYQMFRIISSNVVNQISPEIINVFNEQGEFKELNNIVEEIAAIPKIEND